MGQIVYVVMKQEIDWGGGPRTPDAVFTDWDKACEYVKIANQVHVESYGAGPPNYEYWVDMRDDIELDPKPWGEIE